MSDTSSIRMNFNQSQLLSPESALHPSFDFSGKLLRTFSVVDQILKGQKPYLDSTVETDALLIDLFQKMEAKELIHENWEQFVLSPGQDPNGKMAKGNTAISVLCYPLTVNGKVWGEFLGKNEIKNVEVLGVNPALRLSRDEIQPASVAQSFILPEGDFDSLDQFLKILSFNKRHPSSARTLVVDNQNGFWDGIKGMMSDKDWASLEVKFITKNQQAVDFILQEVGVENAKVSPVRVPSPFNFDSEKTPVLLLGTGNAKKIEDTRSVMMKRAPLVTVSDFISSVGLFTEPPEESVTCVGNAAEKMEAMLEEVYREPAIYETLMERFGGRPVVLVANDTGARIQFVDSEGNIVPVDFLNRPELKKSREFMVEGKERWFPAAEVKMVSSAEGKSTYFYTEKLPELQKVLSEELGFPVSIKYVDDSVFLHAVLTPERKDIKFFATKGVHQDNMIFEIGDDVGSVDYENFTVPLNNNPYRKTRAELGAEALLTESSTANAIQAFLNVVYSGKPQTLSQEFSKTNGNVYAFPTNKFRIGTLSAFSPDSSSFGHSDFTRIVFEGGFRKTSKKYDFTDMESFEKFLGSIDGLLLGGNEGLNLTPLQRIAMMCRVMVAVQTAHPSFAGKPLIFVNDDKMDPVCDWMMNTQDFLYNHKLFGRRAQDTFKVERGLRSALQTARQVLSSYVKPIEYSLSASCNGDDRFDRPTVSILGSASTYDPQHIKAGQDVAVWCAENNLHLRHGGCSRGVVGGAADAFVARRDETSKGRMTGIQCHGLMRMEGMNEGNDCAKIHKTIGERKLDIYQSDIQVFASGGWGTYEELFDLLALVEAKKVKPDSIIILDYGFDAAPNETTYQPVREFMNKFMTAEQIQKMNIHFVSNASEAMKIIDSRLPFLWNKYRHMDASLPSSYQQSPKIA